MRSVFCGESEYKPILLLIDKYRTKLLDRVFNLLRKLVQYYY